MVLVISIVLVSYLGHSFFGGGILPPCMECSWRIKSPTNRAAYIKSNSPIPTNQKKKNPKKTKDKSSYNLVDLFDPSMGPNQLLSLQVRIGWKVMVRVDKGLAPMQLEFLTGGRHLVI